MRLNLKRYVFGIGLALLLALLGSSVRTTPPAEALSRSVTQQVVKSVVQIIAFDVTSQGRIQPKWVGTGSIVTKDGLILTNCHVALPAAMFGSGPENDRDGLIVALTTRTDKPPTPMYVGEVAQYDPDLDLAIVRITKTLDGAKVNPTSLNLPTLPVGDSDEVELGDELFIFGYPTIGGETITFTSGNVSGFVSERGIEGRAWIKTDATIAGGNSGGTGVNDEGILVGVPTLGGAGHTEKIVDCRVIQDTNGDGKLDDKDTCLPFGGFINSLRPVNLAKPLIEAAKRGLAPAPQPTPGRQPSKNVPTGKTSVSRMIFASGVNDFDQPISVVSSYPAGVEAIYLFFDYADFQDGTPWHAELSYNNGQSTDSWPVTNWNGGSAGLWWIGHGGQALSDGTYEFTIFYDNKKLNSAAVKVGGATPKNQPVFGNISFAGDGQAGFMLPAGVTEVEATVQYANITASTDWSYLWYFDGEKVAGNAGKTFSQPSGKASLSLSAKEGFPPGVLRLEIYLGNDLAATSDLLISGQSKGKGGGQQQTSSGGFGPITFGSQLDRNKQIADPGKSFRSGIDTLYAGFAYQGMKDGWTWTRRWSIDGQVVIDNAEAWEGGEQGEGYNLWISNRQGALPDGEYKLELLIQGQLVQSGTAQIGKGSAPPSPTPIPSAQGVQIYGYIVDADTGRGIPSSAFLVLKPGITASQFQWTEDELWAAGEADNNGYYELSAPLLRGETYTFIIGAKGYQTYAEDGITVPSDIESPYQLNAELQRGY